MLVRKLAMFLGGRCMMLCLFVFAALVVMVGLVVVMRSGVMVTGRTVVMLGRRMFCHFERAPVGLSWDGPKLNRPTFPVRRGIADKPCALRASWQWHPREAQNEGERANKKGGPKAALKPPHRLFRRR
jgi:hypothetical protein